MSTSSDKKKRRKSIDPPEQKLGDTPIPPWDMPTPEEKAKAKPVRRALKEAISKVESEEKADEVLDQLEAATADETVADVEKTQPEQGTSTVARKVEKVAKTAPKGEQTERVLDATARAAVSGDKRQREVISEAAQEVLNPQQQGARPVVESEQQREYLRHAVLKRLKPLDALDANVFLAINHLTHTRFLNTLFYGLTVAFNGAAVWHAIMGIVALRNREEAKNIAREMTVPLLITTSLVEFPIKPYFKRRRPFIAIIQAIVIGKKPGTWSFPSGHAAGAFAGAWLLNRKYPKWGILRYVLAAWVAFSRVYLGDHYPGDVVSGSVIGVLFAMLFRRLTKPGGKGER